MERLEGEKKELVLDAELDGEPVKVDEGGGDVLPGLGTCEDPGSRVLYMLESVQVSIR